MTLQVALTWLTTAGSGLAAYWIIRRLNIESWRPDWKRYLAYALTAVIAIGAYLLRVLLGYVPAPVGQAWAETLFAVAMVAFGVSQLPHALVELRQTKAVATCKCNSE
jgi:hypothetical protein